MNSIHSILVATDLSVDASHAVRRAALLAYAHGARLHILHVVDTAGFKPLGPGSSRSRDTDSKATQAREALRRLALEVSVTFDLTASVEVATGAPFETLMRAGESADLVVLGRRGHRRFKAWREGRTVDRMLRICRRPVLVVKTPAQAPYRRVLVPIDFTPTSDAALRVADRMRGKSDLHVFHALQSNREAVLRDADVAEPVIRESRPMEEGALNAHIRRRVAGLGVNSTTTRYALAYGPAERTALLHAQGLGADLIVVGRQGRSTLAGFLMGSVSRRILSEARCDVLIVPRPRETPCPQIAETVTPDVHTRSGLHSTALVGGMAERVDVPANGHWIHNKPRFVSRRTS
jgi:nucleotide-binding universal stress UspA family protein